MRDDPAQFTAASRLMAAAEEGGVPVMLLFGVLLETDGLQHEDEAALEEALFRWKESKAGFTDCMLAAKAGLLRRQPFMTFDAAAARLPGAQLLG
ncbi:hypothetical protein [Aquincola tertiaricarbonis]|nr:hypothetical protein [Aquincola tertiaricarbonis]